MADLRRSCHWRAPALSTAFMFRRIGINAVSGQAMAGRAARLPHAVLKQTLDALQNHNNKSECSAFQSTS